MVTVSSVPLDVLHARQQIVVVPFSVVGVMHAAMAIRAKGDNEARVIGAAITCSSDVVRLEIRRSISATEWCWLVAALASAGCSGKDVCFHVSGALVNGSLDLADRRRGASSGEGKLTQAGKSIGGQLRGLGSLNDSIETPELKDDGLSCVAVGIAAISIRPALAHHLPCEGELALWIVLLEHQDRSAVFSMVGDGLIAAGELHVTSLTFAEIQHSSIRANFVIVAKLNAPRSGHDEYQSERWSDDDARLAVTTEPRVDVLTPIVAAPNLKPIRHARSPHSDRSAVFALDQERAAA